jgi:uncharacterized protein YbjT (DUF2867 family)
MLLVTGGAGFIGSNLVAQPRPPRDRGRRPFTELEDGVARYVRDYLSRPDSYR